MIFKLFDESCIFLFLKGGLKKHETAPICRFKVGIVTKIE
jgi:hypothetical protein